jgi:hypothetical protein
MYAVINLTNSSVEWTYNTDVLDDDGRMRPPAFFDAKREVQDKCKELARQNPGSIYISCLMFSKCVASDITEVIY